MTKPDLTAERSHWQTLKSLAPYLWPVGEPGLRARVVISLLLLVVLTALGLGLGQGPWWWWGWLGVIPASLVPWSLGRRLGGHSGDSYGACVEWTTSWTLLLLALGPVLLRLPV